jgi:signal transduction histidine kinase
MRTSVGQLLAALVHDLRNPLGVIRCSAQLMLDEQQPQDVKHEVTRYINDLLRYARQKPPEAKFVSPESLVHLGGRVDCR